MHGTPFSPQCRSPGALVCKPVTRSLFSRTITAPDLAPQARRACRDERGYVHKIFVQDGRDLRVDSFFALLIAAFHPFWSRRFQHLDASGVPTSFERSLDKGSDYVRASSEPMIRSPSVRILASLCSRASLASVVLLALRRARAPHFIGGHRDPIPEPQDENAELVLFFRHRTSELHGDYRIVARHLGDSAEIERFVAELFYPVDDESFQFRPA